MARTKRTQRSRKVTAQPERRRAITGMPYKQRKPFAALVLLSTIYLTSYIVFLSTIAYNSHRKEWGFDSFVLQSMHELLFYLVRRFTTSIPNRRRNVQDTGSQNGPSHA